MRGIADDMALMRWLREHIWPAEAKNVSPQFVKDGTLLACAEMLRGGVTCFNDMYFFPEAALEAALAANMRACLGAIVIDFPSAYAADPDDYLRKGLALRDRYTDHPLFSFCLARQSWTCRCMCMCTRQRRKSRVPKSSMAPGHSSDYVAWDCSDPGLSPCTRCTSQSPKLRCSPAMAAPLCIARHRT
jgi:hypothetical protein